MPDLVAAQVVAPDFGLPGELIDVAWTLGNFGAVAVPLNAWWTGPELEALYERGTAWLAGNDV